MVRSYGRYMFNLDGQPVLFPEWSFHFIFPSAVCKNSSSSTPLPVRDMISLLSGTHPSK